MPRDSTARATIAELPLSGHRRARVVPADDAGEVRLVVQDGCPLDKMLRLGWIDRDEHAAAALLLQQFEMTGLRQRTGGSYSGVVVDHSDASSPFETMDASQLAAWRRLGKLLNQVPAQCRTQVTMVTLWHAAPWHIPSLRRGLAVLARRMHRPG
jgi:hypothetical protein